MKVLYVEDNPLDADLTLRMMRKLAPHLQFETVSTIQEAVARLEHLSDKPLDLVLTDLGLRDGLATAFALSFAFLFLFIANKSPKTSKRQVPSSSRSLHFRTSLMPR